MKYFLFSTLVVGSMGFLLFDGGKIPGPAELRENALAAIEQVLGGQPVAEKSEIPDIAAKGNNRAAVAPEPAITSPPAPETAPLTPAPVAEELTGPPPFRASPARENIDTSEPGDLDTTSLATTGPETAPGSTRAISQRETTAPLELAEGTRLMTPRERKRELDALIADMENFYLDALVD